MVSKPVLFAVDDDPEVLRAVERDLRRKYGRTRNGGGYRILMADSAVAALDTLGKLKLRGDPVALFLVDQRMPRTTGVEFLEEAKELYPEAKKVLLTAYADTDAAIKAINDVGLDFYLQKPWDPPEENLYPILDDLLGDWRANYRPPFEGIRVVGNRWSPESHRVKDFLARNRVHYQWQDVEVSEEARKLVAQTDGDQLRLPLVVFPDGTYLEAPENIAVAEKVGLRTRAERPFYDLIIVGGGPSGLAAAVYGASEGLKTVLIEREAPGGQAGMSSRIENYLGFPKGLSGGDLSQRAVTQARRFEVEILTPQEVQEVRIEDPYRVIRLADGSELSCHVLLIATGVSYRKLEVPGVERLSGAGVFYGAAMTEALESKDEDVYIVGGANSVGQAAMYFSRHARKAIIICRSNDLRKGMSSYLVNQIEDTPNIEVRLNSNVVEAFGEDHLEKIRIKSSATGEEETVQTRSLFIFIGAAPKTDWLEGVVERDERGFILSGPDLIREGKPPKNWTEDREPYLLETSVPGIFVAGDVRHGSIKRVASGVGEGSIAVQFIHQYLAKV
jgi:thioredoxin reductase (NADPH)